MGSEAVVYDFNMANMLLIADDNDTDDGDDSNRQGRYGIHS